MPEVKRNNSKKMPKPVYDNSKTRELEIQDGCKLIITPDKEQKDVYYIVPSKSFIGRQGSMVNYIPKGSQMTFTKADFKDLFNIVKEM